MLTFALFGFSKPCKKQIKKRTSKAVRVMSRADSKGKVLVCQSLSNLKICCKLLNTVSELSHHTKIKKGVRWAEPSSKKHSRQQFKVK